MDPRAAPAGHRTEGGLSGRITRTRPVPKCPLTPQRALARISDPRHTASPATAVFAPSRSRPRLRPPGPSDEPLGTGRGLFANALPSIPWRSGFLVLSPMRASWVRPNQPVRSPRRPLANRSSSWENGVNMHVARCMLRLATDPGDRLRPRRIPGAQEAPARAPEGSRRPGHRTPPAGRVAPQPRLHRVPSPRHGGGTKAGTSRSPPQGSNPTSYPGDTRWSPRGRPAFGASNPARRSVATPQIPGCAGSPSPLRHGGGRKGGIRRLTHRRQSRLVTSLHTSDTEALCPTSV